MVEDDEKAAAAPPQRADLTSAQGDMFLWAALAFVVLVTALQPFAG